MGLDNGFVVKSNKRKLTRADLPKEIQYPFAEDYGDAPEIIYWRKNWGLRNMMVRSILRPEHPNKDEDDNYIYSVDTSKDVMNVISAISYFLNEEIWESEGSSIWSYEEIRPILIENIGNLAIMAIFMDQNPDVYLEFYDSY